MGQTYDVYCTLKPKNESETIRLMNEYIDQNEGKGVIFSLENSDRETLEGLMKIFITDRQFQVEEQPNGIKYSSGFDASYGWETVMLEMFKYISESLEDKSEIVIYPDSGRDRIIIKNGKAIYC